MKLLCCALLSLLMFTVQAQRRAPFCGTDGLKALEPGLFKVPAPAAPDPRASAATSNAVYTIPVLFVVYHTGEPVGTGANLSDQRIQDALDELNRSFRGSYPNGLDANIRFVLARRLPDCSPTSGIHRIDASAFPNYASQGITSYEEASSLAAAYAPVQKREARDFVTVRIVRDLTFAAGFAYFGGDIFMDQATTGGGTFTLAHEMGHVLSLFHTFEGSTPENPVCPPNTNPNSEGDGVADTDPHRYGDFSCQATENNPCTARPFGLLGVNLMNYACGQLFSPGQINRMRGYLISALPSLITSPFGEPLAPGEIIKPVSCSLVFGYPPTNYINGISRVQFHTIDFFSERFPTGRLAGLYNDHSCRQRTTVQAGTSYTLNLLAYSNNRKVYIDFNNDGQFNETNELVFSTRSGASSATITIPTAAVRDVFLRMRVVVDEGPTPPTACTLPGDPVYGCGEIEDYGLRIASACTDLYTLRSGTWSDPTIWSCGRVPTASDPVTVAAGHTVTLTANGVAKALSLQGTLVYSAGTKLDLGQ